MLADSTIVFVCGAKSDSTIQTNRDLFLKYAKKHLSYIKFFKAEKAYRPSKSNDEIDLLTLEKDFAGYSDCILMILESQGCLAELGAFAMHDDVVKKILVVNDSEWINQPSFIRDGPLKKIKNKSIFKLDAIYTSLSKHLILDKASMISDKLDIIKRTYSKRIDLNVYATLNKELKIKMLFISDIISVYSPIGKSGLIHILRKLYPDEKFIDIDNELGLLFALGMIKDFKTDNGEVYFYNTTEAKKSFMTYAKGDLYSMRSNVINYYHKNRKDMIKIYLERSRPIGK